MFRRFLDNAGMYERIREILEAWELFDVCKMPDFY